MYVEMIELPQNPCVNRGICLDFKFWALPKSGEAFFSTYAYSFLKFDHA